MIVFIHKWLKNAVSCAGWSFDGEIPKEQRVQNVYEKRPAIFRGWADLSNVEREAAALLGWRTASWIARDAAPLAAMRLHGCTLASAQQRRLIGKEEKALLVALGFDERHVFGIYHTDAEAPPHLHETQVFVTVKHSDGVKVAESLVPQQEIIEGQEATFATKPSRSDAPRRSGTFWQQGYTRSTLRPEDPPLAAKLGRGSVSGDWD
jgi:hypothetical protein